MDKKSKTIVILNQWANEIVNNGLVLIDDHIHALRAIDHLVILECGDNAYLCPIVDNSVVCCLNMIDKDEDGGYHLTRCSVGSNVWNKDEHKTIWDRCDDYNRSQDEAWPYYPSGASHITKVIC